SGPVPGAVPRPLCWSEPPGIHVSSGKTLAGLVGCAAPRRASHQPAP
ncbi:hypothetical protein H8958_005540, partial [Nasalis larvatus]